MSWKTSEKKTWLREGLSPEALQGKIVLVGWGSLFHLKLIVKTNSCEQEHKRKLRQFTESENLSRKEPDGSSNSLSIISPSQVGPGLLALLREEKFTGFHLNKKRGRQPGELGEQEDCQQAAFWNDGVSYWNKYKTTTKKLNVTKVVVAVIQLPSHVQLFATPWTATTQARPSSTISWSLLKLMSIELVVTSNHLISVVPFSSHPQSFSVSGSFPMSRLFTPGGRS